MASPVQIEQECATLRPGSVRTFWLSEALTAEKVAQMASVAESKRKDGKSVTMDLGADGLHLTARIGQ